MYSIRKSYEQRAIESSAAMMNLHIFQYRVAANVIKSNNTKHQVGTILPMKLLEDFCKIWKLNKKKSILKIELHRLLDAILDASYDI